MSPADAARLELAKRAFRATQPTELEVQTGVRRARLSLVRPKQRRKWFLKGLVFVVLALGGLAYAKPHALGELVERGLSLGPAEKRLASRGRASDTTVTVREPSEAASRGGSSAAPSPIVVTEAASPRPAAPVSLAPDTERPTARRAKSRASALPTKPSASGTGAPSVPPGEEAVSDWGRVGQALAQGDEAGALAALGKLSHSDDESTRDKADLGRAQLMMANGEKPAACELARALVHRRAVGHVQRQASQLLSACAR